MNQSDPAEKLPTSDPIKTLERALLYLAPRLTSGLTVGLHFNADDEVAMLIRDAIFVLQSKKHNSRSDVRKARRGYWQLRPEFREAIRATK